MNKLFRLFAEKASFFTGTSWAFILALLVLMGWAASGPLFGFSQQWQLVINSFTTIVTFLMVFVIQNTQNRDFMALHLKLDELIRSNEDAHPGLIALQNLSDEELSVIEKGFERLRRRSSGGVREVLKEIEELAKSRDDRGKTVDSRS
jgi:low affinity Fe/Cu permease